MQNSYRESIRGSLSYCTPPMNIYPSQGVIDPFEAKAKYLLNFFWSIFYFYSFQMLKLKKKKNMRERERQNNREVERRH